MGYAKRMLIEEQNREYGSMGKTYVCSHCFQDVGLIEFIEKHGKKNNLLHCSFCDEYCAVCGQDQSCNVDDIDDCPYTPSILKLDLLIEHILHSIRHQYYSEMEESPMWEDGKHNVEGDDLYDIVELEIDGDSQVIPVIQKALSVQGLKWFKKTIFDPNYWEIWTQSWVIFADLYKKHGLKIKDSELKSLTNIDPYEDPNGQPRPDKILRQITHIINNTKLIKKIPVGKVFFRVRPGGHFTNYKELCPPPPICACNQRMSPANIVMFYCAENDNTACVEATHSLMLSDWTNLTIAQFESVQPMRVLDLFDIPEFPSLFSETMGHLQHECLFLAHFQDEISKPINSSTLPEEYIPTQALTRFLMNDFKDATGHINGIAYRSSLNKGKCYVFFYDSSVFAPIGGILSSTIYFRLKNQPIHK